MRLTIRPIMLAALAMIGLPVWADDTTLNGQFANVTLLDDGIALPTGFTNVSLLESPVNWQCDAGVCAPTGDMKVSVVFSSTNGQPVSITSQNWSLPDMFVTGTPATLLDPNGQTWGTATADVGKWSIGVDITSQTPPGGDRQFASAYGQYNLTYPARGVLPVQPPVVSGTVQQTKVLGLSQVGMVTAGPGSNGTSAVDADGNPLSPGLFQRVQIQLDGARWAYPSSTNVTCSSLTCMDYQTGSIGVDQLVFSFDVALRPLSVPEAPTLPMMVLGMGGLAWIARRQGRGRA